VNNKTKHEELTQKYSTWGDKLLQHTDVLYSIQKEKTFKPITIQLAPTEACNSDCPFCSVAGRPMTNHMPFTQIQKVLSDFRDIGAKSVEITGGGNPLLYKDNETKKDINDIIEYASSLGFDIGIITNNHTLTKIKTELYDKINWVRISLIQLDEGKEPEEYNFNNIPYSKLGFSYIIYDSTNGIPDKLSRKNKPYVGTTIESIKKIARLVDLHPDVKFVRIAGNCLIKGNNKVIKDKWGDILNEIDKQSKIFIKDIGDNDLPYNDGCYVGAIRPYVASNPHRDGKYQIYTCTSHVLNNRNYDLDYSLGGVEDVKEIWGAMNKNYKEKGYLYEVKSNCGKNWRDSCKYCYYNFNNKLLHTVASEMPDKNFP
jgi:MoaA/NifB/PqqE/SkfB family radical SAM enzyme